MHLLDIDSPSLFYDWAILLLLTVFIIANLLLRSKKHKKLVGPFAAIIAMFLIMLAVLA